MNAPLSFENLLEGRTYSQLINRFDHETRTLWSYMNPSGRTCFNRDLLQDLEDFGDTLQLNRGKYLTEGNVVTVDFVVLASNVPGIFNLGGDLATFSQEIQSGDKDALERYAHLCIDIIWNRLNHYDAPITTISLIQGKALGGGLEVALTADVVIAEEGSTIGLPEILFNLFPGMGALSLLSRKIGMRQAEEIVLSGKMYSAEELYERGVVDVIAAKDAGPQAVDAWIKQNSRRRIGYCAVQRSKQRIMPISYDELIGITDIWVDSAMQLNERDLRMMGRLVQAQNRIVAHAPLKLS